MEGLVGAVNGIIWSSALIYLCLGAGLFYSIMTRFAQVRLFGEMLRLIFKGKASVDGISFFQALAFNLIFGWTRRYGKHRRGSGSHWFWWTRRSILDEVVLSLSQSTSVKKIKNPC